MLQKSELFVKNADSKFEQAGKNCVIRENLNNISLHHSSLIYYQHSLPDLFMIKVGRADLRTPDSLNSVF